MKQIIRIRMNELRNSEHPLVVNRIVSIVKKHDPETLLIEASLLRVENHLPMLAKVEARSRQHSLTKLLTELDGKRDNLTNALYRQVRVMKQVKIPELAAHRKVLEVLGNTTMINPSGGKQLSGLGFNATVRDEVIVRLQGTHKRVVKIKF